MIQSLCGREDGTYHLLIKFKFNTIFINPPNAKGYFCPKHKDTAIFENDLNPVILVFTG